MRIVFLSDTHLIDVVRGEPLIVPDGDVVVHCGDALMRGSYDELKLFAQRFAALPHKNKVFVPGNHDVVLEENIEAALNIDWAHCLIDRGLTIDGVKFWGSPWQPEFCNWAFNLPRGPELKRHWDMIPEGTDVLVTHTPPMGVLDRVWRHEKRYVKDKHGHIQIKWKKTREHVGCADMLLAVQRVKPKYHAFGHIHCDYGVARREDIGTTFINCALADEGYHLVHRPVVIDL